MKTVIDFNDLNAENITLADESPFLTFESSTVTLMKLQTKDVPLVLKSYADVKIEMKSSQIT